MARGARPAVALLAALAAAVASPAQAQVVRAELYASGLQQPVALVADPADRTVQYIVEKKGHIRVIRNGSVLDDDFLDISSELNTVSELGLLGLAFAPDYAASGRFFVFFSNHDAHSVVARFVRSADNPFRADPASRFDLFWPEGNRFISQPSLNHKGGNLAFGPDGYLYIGLGDGGEGHDTLHLAQNPGTLHGKMLRLDVNVSDNDFEGYDVPDSNPFVGQDGVLPEIWALGLRNPWRWSFDDQARGGTGALVITDVGQDAWEEVNYVPYAAAGRNYGWRLREGAHDFDTSLPGFPSPLTDPIFEYSHEDGRSIIGGYVNRGGALGSGNNGRYFFADFVSSRVWSLGLSIDGAGEAVATDLIEHTADLDLPGLLPSSFGVDADGDLYLLSYSKGQIFRLISASTGLPNPVLRVESPAPGGSPSSFVVSGWAVDLGSAQGPGVDDVHVWAVPAGGAPSFFLGSGYGAFRGDVAAAYGSRFANSGFAIPVSGLPHGQYLIIAYAHSTVSQTFAISQVITITVGSWPLMNIDLPQPYESFAGRFPMAGWALDLEATSGSGVREIQVWAQRDGEGARFLGLATLGISRPDLGAAFGPQFNNSGWAFVGGDLPPDTWTITAHMVSAVTGGVVATRTVMVTLTDGLQLWVDTPTAGAVLPPGTHHIAGWVLDTAALTGTGVSAAHVWAVPSNGDPAVFLGLATMGLGRPDVAAAFGPQFAQAGFDRSFNLPPGDYDIIVYPVRSTTNGFDRAQVVHITIAR